MSATDEQVAAALVAGNGTPRSREQVVRDVTAALQNAREEGRRAGAREARAAVLREAIAIEQRAEADALARRRTLERELRDLAP